MAYAHKLQTYSDSDKYQTIMELTERTRFPF